MELAYTKAIEEINEEALSDADTIEEKIQMKVQIEMAKSRDQLYVEEEINEADIELTISELDLEGDKEYVGIMKASQEMFERQAEKIKCWQIDLNLY